MVREPGRVVAVRQVNLRFDVVLPDDTDTGRLLTHMLGREFPGLRGSWVVTATNLSADVSAGAGVDERTQTDDMPDQRGDAEDDADDAEFVSEDHDPGDADPGD